MRKDLVVHGEGLQYVLDALAMESPGGRLSGLQDALEEAWLVMDWKQRDRWLRREDVSLWLHKGQRLAEQE